MANTKPITVKLPITLLDELDKYADSMNINRTSAICVLCSQGLKNDNALKSFEALVKMVEAEKNATANA